LETVYLENGEEMSGSTVAAPFGNLILMGNVMDDHFLILKKY
jgi:arylesterase/paraoxonase